MSETAAGETAPDRLVAVTLDPASIGPGSAAQEHERRAALDDLLASNTFRLVGHERGPYRLTIGLHEGRLAFDIQTVGGEAVAAYLLSLRPLRSIVRDYMLLRENHETAMRTATAAQIEVIDMGRRGLHNEGAQRLADRLADKITADFDTMRRLFTLVSALHWKG